MLEMKDILTKFFESVRDEIIREQKEQGRYVTGKTSEGLEIETTNNIGTLFGGISALALETGRKPGKVPFNFTDVILKWINDKGIFNGSESKKRSIAFLIARKIREDGTRLYKDGGNSGVLSNAITQEKVAKFSSEVLRKFGREIQDEIIIDFKR